MAFIGDDGTDQASVLIDRAEAFSANRDWVAAG